MNELYMAHRCIGRFVGKLPDPDGSRELIVLETYPCHQHEAVYSHMCAPATLRDVQLHIFAALANVAEEARFLGLNTETLEKLAQQALREEVMP